MTYLNHVHCTVLYGRPSLAGQIDLEYNECIIDLFSFPGGVPFRFLRPFCWIPIIIVDFKIKLCDYRFWTLDSGLSDWRGRGVLTT